MRYSYYLTAISAGLLLFIFSNEPVVAQTDQQINRLQELARESRTEWQIRNAGALDWAERVGVPVRRTFPDGTVIELQKFDEHGHPVYYITNNLDAAETSSVDAIWPGGGAGLDLTGDGYTITMWETGVPQITHQELTGRITHGNTDADVTSHATHVAGTMIASGVDPDAQGMAWEASVEAYRAGNNVSEQATVAADGMQASNHSWGRIMGWNYDWDDEIWEWYGNTDISENEDYKFGFYNSQAQAWDDVMHNAPEFLIVKAAGNDRNDAPDEQPVEHRYYDRQAEEWVTAEEEDGIVREPDGGDDGYTSLGMRATAKNILTVGAVWSSTAMTSFSSWGPTNDGRIKPDIVAKGRSVYSSDVDDEDSDPDQHYSHKSGTSMASPVVTGAVTLLQEHYNNLHGENPRASTIKSLIIHTADELDDEGPDYRNGWGLLNAERAAEVISKDYDDELLDHLHELSLNNGQTYEHQVWSDGEEPLRATIVWTDPAGEPVDPAIDATDRMLVNDLDLRLIDDAGNEHEPYILDPSDPSAAATTGDNDRDNVEQVYIEAPERGYYTVQVTHKGSLEDGSQGFSMVVTGNEDPADAPPGFLTFADEGEEGYAWAPHTTGTDVSGDHMTIEFWMKMDASSDEDAIIVSKKSSDDGSNGYRIRLVGDGEERPLRFTPSDRNSRHVTTNTGIRADEWTHISAVYDDGDAYIYINGQLDVENTTSDRRIGSTSRPLTLGSNTNRDGQFYRGHLGDVRIWNTSRNMFSIREDFTTPLEGDEAGLVVYYPFSVESTQMSSDASGGDSDLSFVDIKGTEEPGVFPVTPLVYGQIGDQSAELKIYERPFFEESYAESVASEYRIYRTENGSRTEVETVSAGSDEVFYTDDGLSNGQTYYYEVTVLDEDGNESDFSNPLPLTPNQQIGGTSLSFEDQGYVALSNRPNLNISGDELTIEFWIKRDADSEGKQAILTNKTTTGGNGYGVYLTDGGEEARIRFRPTDRTGRHITSDRGIRADEWTHIAVVYNDGTSQIYINGELDRENVSSSRRIGSTSNDLTLGSNTQLNDQWFQGQIDELKIWDRRRSVTEIISDYNRPLWGDEEGLAGYWRFDASAGNRIYGQAMRPATAEGVGSVTHEESGIYPVPPGIHAEPDAAEDRITLHLEQPEYADEEVQEYRIYRYSDSESRSLLTTLSGGESVYHDEITDYGTTWFYDATIVDSDGGESDIAYPVTATLHDDRPAGNAVRFSTNQSAYIQFEYNPALDISGDSITVEAWVMKDDASQEGAVILANNQIGSNGYQLYFVDDGPASRVRFNPTDRSGRNVTSQTILEPGEWYHIAGVYRDGDTWLYINGALDNTSTSSSRRIGSSSHGLVIGANHLGSDDYFIGEIDEVRIWNRPLEKSEITSHYNRTRIGNEEELVGYWRFDEPDGNIVRGSAQRPLHGTLVNGPTFVPSAAMEGDPFSPVLATPESGAEDQDIPLTFTWYPVDNAQHYEMEISPNADFRSVIFEKEIADTAHAVEMGLEFDSTFHWRVRAVTNQFETNWSSSRQFSTLLPVPDAPHWEPDEDAEDVELPVAFSWGESEFAETYRVQVSDDSEFTATVLDTAGIAENVLVADNLEPNSTYYWRVSASNESGESEWSDTRQFSTVITSADDMPGDIPEDFELRQNYPNPFNPSTVIRFSLPEDASVDLEVYTVTGQRVATLISGEQRQAGHHTATFDATNLSSGMYIYRIRAGDFTESKSMMFVK